MRLEAQLVAGVGGVGDQLAQEDLPVAVQRVDHELQQLADFGLETVRLPSASRPWRSRGRHARRSSGLMSCRCRSERSWERTRFSRSRGELRSEPRAQRSASAQCRRRGRLGSQRDGVTGELQRAATRQAAARAARRRARSPRRGAESTAAASASAVGREVATGAGDIVQLVPQMQKEFHARSNSTRPRVRQLACATHSRVPACGDLHVAAA